MLKPYQLIPIYLLLMSPLESWADTTYSGTINSTSNASAVSGNVVYSAVCTTTGYDNCLQATGNTNLGSVTITNTSLTYARSGVELDTSTLSGALINYGTISASLSISTSLSAIRVTTTTIQGGITNNGTLSGGSNGAGIGLYSGTTINGGIVNNGTINKGIDINWATVTGGITNSASGIITIRGIVFDPAAGPSSTDFITNAGSISTTGSSIVLFSPYSPNNDASTVGSISNSGTITASGSGDAPSAIKVLPGTSITGWITNTGTLLSTGTGIPGFGIYNAGSITGVNNQQGLGNSSGALTYSGVLPGNYNIIVKDSSTFGQLSASSVTGTTSFGISSLSTTNSAILNVPLTSVLSGITPANLGISGTSITGTSNGYTYTLSQTGTNTNIWNLVINCISSVCNYGTAASSSGSSSGSSSAPTLTNITSGTSVGLSSIGVTFNPVLEGGTLVLTQGQRSGQTLSILGTGSSITAPTTGAAQLHGVLSGSGKLTFNGSGMTVLSGANTYTGGTIVESGTLSLLGGTLGSGDVYVAPGAQLVGTGSISGPVTVAGLFKPGNSPGYIGVNANVVMTSGAVYQQDIAGTTQASEASPVGVTGYYSYLNITGGQFVINSGSTLTPALSNLFNTLESGYGSTPYTPVLGDRFRIVTADGGISGKFSSVTQPAGLAADTQFLPFYNMAGSNSIDLAVIPTSYKTTVATASGNKNAQSVGSALDRMVVAAQSGTSTAAQDQLLYAGSTKTVASLGSYAQGLSGEVYPAAVAVIAQTTQRVQQSVLSRLGDTMGLGLPSSMISPAGNTGLMSTTNIALSGGVANSGVSSNPGVNPNAEAKAFSNGNVWGDLAYQYGNRNSDSNSGGWNSNLYQLVFGSDFFTDNGMKIGGGLALSSTTLNPTYGSGTIQQGSLFAYGKMPIEEYVVDAMASFGLNNSDLSRGDGTGLTGGFRSKSISGNDAMVSLGLSRPFDTDSIRITPFARVTWQIVTQNGVNEGGAVSALGVNSFTGNGVRGMLGVAAGSKVNDPMTEQYTYRAYVGVGADSSGVLNPTLNASLAGMGTNITTPNAGTTFVQAGLYGTAKVSDNAYAFAGLSGEARSGQTLGTVNVGLRVQF